MGDRTYVSLIFRKSDTPKLAKVFDGWVGESREPADVLGSWFNEFYVDDNEQSVMAADYDANYAYRPELTKLAEEIRVPFYGCHFPGGDYEAGVFVSWDGRYIEMIGSPYAPVLPVDDDGNPEPGPLALAKEYATAVKKVKAYLAKE